MAEANRTDSNVNHRLKVIVFIMCYPIGGDFVTVISHDAAGQHGIGNSNKAADVHAVRDFA